MAVVRIAYRAHSIDSVRARSATHPAIEHASKAGALTIGLACVQGSELVRRAGLSIEIDVGPEVIAGSTRLKAGTAQKLVLNAISTIAMVKLGKTFGNLMVDVQASNEKLRARAERAVAIATARGSSLRAGLAPDSGETVATKRRQIVSAALTEIC